MRSSLFAIAILAAFGCFAQAPEAVEVITLSNSCHDCEFAIAKGKTTILRSVAGTTNRFTRIVGEGQSQLVIDGKGTVVVSGDGNLIKVPSLRISDCTLVLKSADAGKDKFKVVDAGDDFVLEGGSVDFEPAADCRAELRVIRAKRIRLQDGRLDIVAPSSGSEIFSADDSITVGGGEMKLVADDDCFSARNNITVDGGCIHATSLSDDVFDSNGDIVVNGGTIIALATAKGHEGFDVDPKKTASGNRPHQLTVNGGTIVATGGKKSDWPSRIVAGRGVKVNALTKLDAAGYSGKSVKFEKPDGTPFPVRFPRFPAATFSLLTTLPLPLEGPFIRRDATSGPIFEEHLNGPGVPSGAVSRSYRENTFAEKWLGDKIMKNQRKVLHI